MPLPKALRPLNKRNAILTVAIRVRLQRRRVAQEQVDADPIDLRAHADAFVGGVVGGRAEDFGLELEDRVVVDAGAEEY